MSVGGGTIIHVSHQSSHPSGLKHVLQPAVGGCMVRTVMAYNFPALCLLLGDHYTAREIDTAWLLMPVVRNRKAARGAPGKGALERRMEKGYGKGYGKRYGKGYGRKGYGR